MEIMTVDTKGAAARLGISPRTLEGQRVYGGGPPFVRLGRTIRYRVADLDAFMAARTINITAQATPA